jgi:hypothetical protein
MCSHNFLPSFRGRTQGGGKGGGRRAAASPDRNFKNIFCRHDIKRFTWFILCRNQPLNSADDKCIGILKITFKRNLDEIKKNRKIRACDLNLVSESWNM